MSNTKQEPEIIPFEKHQVPLLTAEFITSLRDKNTGAHQAVRESLRDIYSAHYIYIANATPDAIKKNRRILNTACENANISTNDTTTDLHKLVKLVVSVNPQLASGYVHVLSVAQALNKTPDEFLDWLKKAGGIEAVRKKFLATGKENPNYESGSTREKNRSDRIANAKNSLKATRCTIDAAVLADANFSPVKEKTECVAIVVRNPDGSLGIKDLVSDKALLDSAYLQHAIEQQTQTNATDKSATVSANEQKAATAELVEMCSA